jgi:tagaturonate reductase
MKLSAAILTNLSGSVHLPEQAHLHLPEKVLQFGTGVLLRGLPDYYIDKANKAGLFNGRVVVVKSTGGSTADFEEQDNLYTLCVRGITNGQKVEENWVNAAISRVLTAASQWEEILACAESEAMEVIISNTTEVGITLTEEDVFAAPPTSFPGKLLAFLYRRYQYFKGDTNKGMVIIPAELIPDNGAKLKGIVHELAIYNGLDTAFLTWLHTANHFCNSLVDRIVPGKLPVAEQQQLEQALGYTDDLMIMAEAYSLWAIETDSEKVKAILSFSSADEGVVIVPDINLFRELKLRLLNGSHTLSCGLAFLAGFDTVKEAMDDSAMETYIRTLLKQELVPAITDLYIREETALTFAEAILDRFRNPHIAHRWLAITMQYTSKLKMRDVPILLKHYQRTQEVPTLMAMGFAAHLLFMRSQKDSSGQYVGTANGKPYVIQDDYAAWYHDQWQRLEPAVLVTAVLQDATVWGTDLTALKGFAHAVTGILDGYLREGVRGYLSKQPS